MRKRPFLLLIALLLFIAGCKEETPQSANPLPQPSTKGDSASAINSVTVGELDKTEQPEVAVNPEKQPPRPPILEDFQGEPKLSLFPRVGDYQPPPDGERHPYWRTFIDHLVKVTGVAENADGSRGWVFRSINSIDSLGYFSPIQVQPNRDYEVTFNLMGDFPDGASAGIGVLEFDEFLWIGEQYTEETFKKHYRGVHAGRRVTGRPDGLQSFTFTTGPDTHMIHLVLFREGVHDRNSLMFDNISIK